MPIALRWGRSYVPWDKSSGRDIEYKAWLLNFGHIHRSPETRFLLKTGFLNFKHLGTPDRSPKRNQEFWDYYPTVSSMRLMG